MVRRVLVGAALGLAAAVWLGAPASGAGAIKLARHPDYHAGKVAFSYLGDIWTASEDGGKAQRLTDNSARETYPRFSPDGKWIAFSSNRNGNNDVRGGRDWAEAVDLSHRQRRGRRLDRDSQNVVFRSARGDGAFTGVATRPDRGYRRPGKGLLVDQLYGTFSPDGKALGHRHLAVDLAVLSGWHAADPGSRTWPTRPTRSSSATSTTTATGRRRRRLHLIRRRRAPERQERQVGSPEVRKSVNNIYKIGAKGAASRFRSPSTPTATSSGRRFERSARRSLRGTSHLEARRRQRPDDRDRSTRHRRQGKRTGSRDCDQRGRRVRFAAGRCAVVFARPDPDDRDRPRRHHRLAPDKMSRKLAEVVLRR